MNVIKRYLEDASKGEHETAARADEENGCHVEEKGDRSVGKEDHGADAIEMLERSPSFGEGEDEEVDDGADL